MLLRISAILLFFTLTLSGLSAQSKRDNRDLLRDLETYKRVTLALNYDSLLSFMPPKMLEVVPADQLKMQLEQAFDNEDIYILFNSMRYGAVPKVQKTGDYLYALVPYTGHMEMHFKAPRDSAFMQMMVPMLESQFSEGAIRLMGSDTLYLSIAMEEKKLIAFKTKDYASWKFIEDKRKVDTAEDSKDMMMLTMFVPEEVVAATKSQTSKD